jgi:protein SCO1/2
VGFRYAWDAETQQFAHAAVLFVLTPQGKVSRYFYGVDFAPRDLRLALVEAAEGKVGTTLDKVLLTCFRFDPATRKYALFLDAWLKGGSLLVFLGLAGLLGTLWRRELRGGRAP